MLTIILDVCQRGAERSVDNDGTSGEQRKEVRFHAEYRGTGNPTLMLFLTFTGVE